MNKLDSTLADINEILSLVIEKQSLYIPSTLEYKSFIELEIALLNLKRKELSKYVN